MTKKNVIELLESKKDFLISGFRNIDEVTAENPAIQISVYIDLTDRMIAESEADAGDEPLEDEELVYLHTFCNPSGVVPDTDYLALYYNILKKLKETV
ncbi:MAG: hypothetical protein V3G42_12125 [Oscillospiraceae bacterium]